ncbi:hypothetical protein XA68_15387 [Ophiocordyceps unilateralis]|uniref:Uncharacterized protein n=1 Tax=Ophiocordyceps unilateralis TaxID=268505 RepID=A0A2A9P8D1_OPHUN|nr:hypothetical protein XA68_15387 [Ophiocordyceps unilateralis]
MSSEKFNQGYSFTYSKKKPNVVNFDVSIVWLDALDLSRNIILFHSALVGRSFLVGRFLRAAVACEFDGFAGPSSAFSKWAAWLSADDVDKQTRLMFGLLPGRPATTESNQSHMFHRAAERVGVWGQNKSSEETADELLKIINIKWGEKTSACLQVLMYRQGAYDFALDDPEDRAVKVERPTLNLPPYFHCPLCRDHLGMEVLCDILDRGEEQDKGLDLKPTQTAINQRNCMEYWDSQRQKCVLMAKDLSEFKNRNCTFKETQIQCGGGLSAHRYLQYKAECQPASVRRWIAATAKCRGLTFLERLHSLFLPSSKD